MQGVNHHFGGHVVTIGVTGGWVRTHRVRSICYLESHMLQSFG
ncbi:hypothetical protein Gohar_009180 [Gossypium harknessii]|uniref:Uncharacterized protein n=1 Tax=Gossypium harknessii TaxID=34285 RepID=A0A7J9GM26_9ROSI|nr:hypothetical protein [Gossypium harknessii]